MVEPCLVDDERIGFVVSAGVTPGDVRLEGVVGGVQPCVPEIRGAAGRKCALMNMLGGVLMRTS